MSGHFAQGRIQTLKRFSKAPQTNSGVGYVLVEQLAGGEPWCSCRLESVGQDMVEKFADGKWHSPDAMAKALDTMPDHVALGAQDSIRTGVFRIYNRGNKIEKPAKSLRNGK